MYAELGVLLLVLELNSGLQARKSAFSYSLEATILEAQKCKMAEISRPSLQHIIGHISAVFVATEAQR